MIYIEVSRHWISKILFLFLCGGLIWPALGYAQGSAGVGISPAVIEDKLDPGEIRQYTFTVTNLNSTEQIFYLSTRDIVGVREGGEPIFAELGQERTGFELSEWITLSRNEVTIPGNGSEEIAFVMSVPETASPGSHFGAVIVSVEPPEIVDSGAAIGYEVANIVTIRISGEVNEHASVRQFATEKYFHGDGAVNFDVRIENEGNTLIRPQGSIIITNMLGSRVAELKFNESAAGVFPFTTRDFRLDWQSASPGFGQYEAVFTATYGEEGAMKSLDARATFWIIPLNILLPALGVLLLLFGLVYVAIRLYVRRTVAVLTAGSSRRIVRQRNPNSFPLLLLIVSLLAVTALLLIILLALFA